MRKNINVDAIELLEPMVITESWKYKLIKFCFQKILIVAVIIVAANYITHYSNVVRDEIKIYWEAAKFDIYTLLNVVEKQDFVHGIDNPQISELVERVSRKHGINSVVLWALIDKESSSDPSRIRYEETWKKAYGKKYPKPANLNTIEYDLHFSSFGLMQVSYIIWKDFCGVEKYTELLDPYKNIDCGTRILSSCLHRRANVNPVGQRLKVCFREYNGSGEMAERYANDIMARLANYMLDENRIYHTNIATNAKTNDNT